MAQFEEENAALREQLLARVQELEGQVAKDSPKSRKPPASDGVARKTTNQRKASDKKSGGSQVTGPSRGGEPVA